MIEKIVFFDLDGTLLDSRNCVQPNVLQCIEMLKKNNHLPVIATGRSISESKEFLSQCEIDSIVSMNGSMIIYNQEMIDSQVISKEICRKLQEFIDEDNDSLSYFSDYDAWSTNHNQLINQVFSSLNIDLPIINKTAYETNEILSMVLCTTKSKEELAPYFPELDFFKVSPYSYDIVLKGVNKGTGVKKFMEFFPQAKSFAFGDGENDLSLFKACDVGIAMGNAVDNLKEIADYISDTNNNEGIKKGLEHYNLI